MTKTTFLITILLIISVSAFAQDSTKFISATKVSGGYRFEQNGKPLTLKSMETIMKDDSIAFDYLTKARSSSTIANILGYAGGFLIGYPLGTALGGGKPEWALAGIGCGLLAIAIPLSSGAGRNARTAVDIYNNNQRNLSFSRKYDLQLGITENGLSLKLRF